MSTRMHSKRLEHASSRSILFFNFMQCLGFLKVHDWLTFLTVSLRHICDGLPIADIR